MNFSGHRPYKNTSAHEKCPEKGNWCCYGKHHPWPRHNCKLKPFQTFFLSLLLLLLFQAKRLNLTAIEELATTMTSEIQTLEGQVQEYQEEQQNNEENDANE